MRLFGLSLALFLCAFGNPAGADALRIGIATLPPSLDPALDRSPASDSILPALCDTLVSLDASGRPIPALARAWVVAPDAKTLTLDLRDDARFADGTPVDATAVKLSLDRSRRMPQSARRAELGAVTGIEVEARTRVRIDLDRPYVPLLSQLAGRAGMIVRPESDEAEEAACTGPYRQVERRPDGPLTFVRNETHWDRTAHPFAQIDFIPIAEPALRTARLRAGALDLVADVPPADVAELAGDPRIGVVRRVEPGWRAILFNVARGPRAQTAWGHDAQLRRTIGSILDRAAIVQEAAAGPHEPGMRWTVPGTIYDTQLAPPATVAVPIAGLAFELIVPARGEDIAVAKAVAAQAQAAGIAIRIITLAPAASAQRIQNGDFEAALVSWRGTIDPDGNTYPHFHCHGARNDSGYCNPLVDTALEAARTSPDINARRAHYAEAMTRLQADAPAIFLQHRATYVAYGARISQFAPAADGALRVRGIRLRE